MRFVFIESFNDPTPVLLKKHPRINSHISRYIMFVLEFGSLFRKDREKGSTFKLYLISTFNTRLLNILEIKNTYN